MDIERKVYQVNDAACPVIISGTRDRLVSSHTAQDGERTLTQEDNYSKVFLMRMPIMVRPIAADELQ